jgi:hypothetical protein
LAFLVARETLSALRRPRHFGLPPLRLSIVAGAQVPGAQVPCAQIALIVTPDAALRALARAALLRHSPLFRRETLCAVA